MGCSPFSHLRHIAINYVKQIAERAELQTSHLSTAVEVAERVISWLEQEEGWLLVVDNLNNIKVLSMGQNSNLKLLLLPSTGDLQHTLITTRNPHYGDIPAQGMEICKYDRDASIQLLYKSSRITPLNQPELQAAERIVEKLCNLPLAIDQAAAYIREMEISFSKFLILYEEYRRDLTKWGPKGPQQYPYTVSTWRMSLAAISTNDPAAVELLRLISFLNPDGVLVEFLQNGAKATGNVLGQIILHSIKSILQNRTKVTQKGLREIILNPIKFEKAISELKRFSLVSHAKHVEGQELLVIHRLVQVIVKDEMLDADLKRFRMMVVNICDEAFPQEWNEKTWARCHLYVGQVIGTLSDPETLGLKESASVTHRVGRFLREDGKMLDSEHLLLRLLEIERRIHGAEHPNTLRSMNELALTYQAQGRTAKAAALQEEVLEKRRQMLGAEHFQTLMSMADLARTYQAQGRTGEAVALQEDVLEKSWRIHGAEHLDTVKSMSNLALIYHAQGRMIEAAALEEDALERSRKILGAQDRDMLKSIGNLALTYQAQGRMADAAALGEERLEKSKQIVGAADPDMLEAMGNLALTYQAQGRMTDAVALQEDALEKSRGLLGAEHPITVKSMGNLALTYKAQSRMAEAAALQEDALEKSRRILGVQHPDTLKSMGNLALTYQVQGRVADAAGLMEERLEKSRQILGDAHPDMLESIDSLALIYQAQGKTAEAAALEKEALEKRRQILGAEHPGTPTSMESFTLILLLLLLLLLLLYILFVGIST